MKKGGKVKRNMKMKVHKKIIFKESEHNKKKDRK